MRNAGTGRPVDWRRMYSPQCGTRPWIVAVVQSASGLSQKLCLPMQRSMAGCSVDGSNDELAERLRREIELLDDGTREIIVMKIFGELTFDEIGSVLNTPAATVATRYRRTLMTLEERLRRNP